MFFTKKLRIQEKTKLTIPLRLLKTPRFSTTERQNKVHGTAVVAGRFPVYKELISTDNDLLATSKINFFSDLAVFGD